MSGDDTPTYGSLSSFPQASSSVEPARATGDTIAYRLDDLDEAVGLLDERLTRLYHRLEKVMENVPPSPSHEETAVSSTESSVSQRIFMAQLKIREISGVVEHIHRRLEI